MVVLVNRTIQARRESGAAGMGMDPNRGNGWGDFTDLNAAYLLDLFDRYRSDPESVDGETRELFRRLGPPPEALDVATEARTSPISPQLGPTQRAAGAGGTTGPRVRVEPLAPLKSASTAPEAEK